MYTIEEMTISDWPEVGDIYLEGIESNLATLETSVGQWIEWDKQHIKNGRYVAKKENRIVGFIAMSEVSYGKVCQGVAEVSIYVKEGNRGNKIGRDLMKKEIEFADSNSLWTIQASILEENEAGIQFFESCGFRRVGHREKIGIDKFRLWRNIALMERRSRVIGYEGCGGEDCELK